MPRGYLEWYDEDAVGQGPAQWLVTPKPNTSNVYVLRPKGLGSRTEIDKVYTPRYTGTFIYTSQCNSCVILCT